MEVTLQIPDELATRMAGAGSDVPRLALEALGLEQFRTGQITKPELRRILGFATHGALDGFLKAHGIDDEYTIDDFERDRLDLSRLGL